MDTTIDNLNQAKLELTMEKTMNKRSEYDHLMKVLRSTTALPAISAIAATNSFGEASIQLRKLKNLVLDEEALGVE
jgi:hypothetical protein